MTILKREESRMNEFIPYLPENPFKKRQKKIKSVRLKKISIDEQYEKDMESGKGFIITNEDAFDKKENRTLDGLYSPLYGIDTFADKELDSAYRCECGEIIGGINEGEYCEKCKTQCMFVDADLSISGYIPLGKFVVINPSCYLSLESLIGGKELDSILKYSTKYDLNGHNVGIKTKQTPYAGLGMIGFYNNFDEIIEYYRNKKKDKEDHYNNIQVFKHAIFTHHINPYSSLLRPLVKNDSRMCLFKVNKYYGIMLTNANILNSSATTDSTLIEGSLYEIQQKFNGIFNELISNDLSGKGGVLRGKVSSARVDFSSRMVIVPATNHHVNEVSIPYIAGLELLRPVLIRELSRIDGINVREANSMIDKGIRKFSKRLWILMNYIIHNSKHPVRALIQRSPSLNILGL